MSSTLKCLCVGVLAVLAHAAHVARANTPPWDRICALIENRSGEDDSELADYLKSLTADEMMSAAKQSCEDAVAQTGEISETMRAARAATSVAVCLQFYVDKYDNPEDAIRRIISVVSDTRQHRYLRKSIIDQMSVSRFNGFVVALQTYVSKHSEDVRVLLSRILENRQENELVRDAAMSALVDGIRSEVVRTCDADTNFQAVKERKRTSVPAVEMVRRGELTLCEDTRQALRGLETHLIPNARVLGRIVADEEMEPEGLRARAQFMLERYRDLPLSVEAQSEIDKALARDKD